MVVKNTIISRIIIGLFLIMLTCWLPASGADNVSVTPVTTPFITIDPIGDHIIGDVFFINGTTNLPVTENLTIEFSFTKYIQRPHMHSDLVPANSSATISDIPILPVSSGPNRWSINVTDKVKELVYGTYFVDIHTSVDYGCKSTGCSIPKAIERSNFILVSQNISTTPITLLTQVQTQFPVQSATISSTQLPIRLVTPLDLSLSVAALGTLLILRFMYGKKRD
jgi:hypothetical protein